MLITLDYYKEAEGITSSDKDDRIELIIKGISELVEHYLGYSLTAHNGENGVIQLFDIQWGTYVVNLKYVPVNQIIGVWERLNRSEDYVQLYSEETSPAGLEWYFDSITDSIIRTTEYGGYKDWPYGVGAVKVQYKAGWTTIPLDIRLAAVDLTNYYLKDEFKSKFTTGNVTVEGAEPMKDSSFPNHIKRVLDLYRL